MDELKQQYNPNRPTFYHSALITVTEAQLIIQNIPCQITDICRVSSSYNDLVVTNSNRTIAIICGIIGVLLALFVILSVSAVNLRLGIFLFIILIILTVLMIILINPLLKKTTTEHIRFYSLSIGTKQHREINFQTKNETEFRRITQAIDINRRNYLMSVFKDIALVDRIMKRTYKIGDHQNVIVEILGNPEVIDEDLLKTKIKHVWKYYPIASNRYRLKLRFEDYCLMGWDDKG